MDNTAIPCGCLFTRLLNIRAYYNGKKLRSFGKMERPGCCMIQIKVENWRKEEEVTNKNLSCVHHEPRFMVGCAV